ncbi:hypothetical protein S40285_01120 [Stachybotrys chlorohalonatus IBT 40285]|uniref:Uncharacterized protein n=1 Tax=Stachybotrys chlorohalonatus (strain IBT 40285) TaxID=1283841 RepID=A0A084QKB2_STAC4|nr:hypothetical protein S40285_01120 [Stachybotrys chlorohalonata IBT 40285]
MSSPRQDPSGRLSSWSKLVTIPADQRVLLEKPEAWIAGTTLRPPNLLHVPDHLLASMREVAARRRAAPDGNRHHIPESPAKRPSTPAHHHHGQDSRQASESPGLASQQPASPQGSIPWSSSPVRPGPQPPVMFTQPPHTMESVVVSSPVQSQLQARNLASQPPDSPPPVSTRSRHEVPPPRQAQHHKSAPLFAFPSSDNDDDPASPRSSVPIRKASLLSGLPLNDNEDNPAATYWPARNSAIFDGHPTGRARDVAVGTPTCAQPSPHTIPCTDLKKNPSKQSERKEPRKKPRQHIIYSPEAVHAPLAGRRMSLPKPVPGLNPSSNNTTLTSSATLPPSSIIPATVLSPSQKMAHGPVRSVVTISSRRVVTQGSPQQVEEVGNALEERAHENVEPEDISTAPSQQAMGMTSPPIRTARKDPGLLIPPQPSDIGHSTTSEPTIMARNKRPFDVYAAEYTEYETAHSGCLWDFVRAIVCLDYLRKTNSLHEGLYDEFIRFFGRYVEYVRNVPSSQQPLAAIEWFSKLKGPILFSRMIVTSENLDEIMSCYPEEVARARQYTKEDPERQEAPKGQEPVTVEREADMADRDEDIQMQTEGVDQQTEEPQHGRKLRRDLPRVVSKDTPGEPSRESSREVQRKSSTNVSRQPSRESSREMTERPASPPRHTLESEATNAPEPRQAASRKLPRQRGLLVELGQGPAKAALPNPRPTPSSPELGSGTDVPPSTAQSRASKRPSSSLAARYVKRIRSGKGRTK